MVTAPDSCSINKQFGLGIEGKNVLRGYDCSPVARQRATSIAPDALSVVFREEVCLWDIIIWPT